MATIDTVTIDRATRDALYRELSADMSGALGDLSHMIGEPERAEEAQRLRQRMRGGVPLLDAIGWLAEDPRDEYELPTRRAGVDWIRERADSIRRCLDDEESILAEDKAALAQFRGLLERLDETSEAVA